MLRRFVRLAGGRQARVVVIPTASAFAEEAVAAYREVFTRLGVGSVEAVDPGSRAAASDPDLVAQVDAATGVFMTGGNQLKLSQYVVGTPLGEAILRAHRRGAVVAGTSAGASIMSLFMISMGEEGVTPRQRASQLTAGLGLLPDVVVDQHFDQRARYGRLLSIVATSPNLLGIGIDEDTAAEVTRRLRPSPCWAPGRCSSSTRAGRSATCPRRAATHRCWCRAQSCTRCPPALPSTCARPR